MTSFAQSIELPTGVTLQYVEQGDTHGEPVLLLHGLADSWRSFEGVLPHLPASIRAIVPTQRGHGDASKPPHGYALADFAADAAAFLERIGVDAAIVVGHSLGAMIAQRFALDYPRRTRGLVLVGALLARRDDPNLRTLFYSVLAPLIDPLDPAFVREFQQSTLAQPVPAEFMDTIVRESLKVPAHVWKAAFQGILNEDFTGLRVDAAIPTLLVWGERDEMCSSDEREALGRIFGHARSLVFPGAGHGVHWEEPQRFADELVKFVGELSTAGSGALIQPTAVPLRDGRAGA